MNQKFSLTLISGWRRREFQYLFFFLLGVANFIFLFPFFKIDHADNIFSAPLIPALTKILSFVFPLSQERLALFLVLIAHILGVMSVCFLVKAITGRTLVGLLAGAFYSFPFDLNKIFDLFTVDGAHHFALSFTPLILILVLGFLRKGDFKSSLFGSVGIALVALTSPFGLLSLMIFLTVVLFSEMLLGQGRIKLLRMLFCLVVALGLASFWYNPKFIWLIFTSTEGQGFVKVLGNLVPFSFFIVPLVGTFGFLLFEKRPKMQSLAISFGLVLIFGLLFFSETLNRGLPQYGLYQLRFFHEFSLSLSFFLAVVVTKMLDYLPKIYPRGLKVGLTILILVVSFLGTALGFRQARNVIEEKTLITKESKKILIYYLGGHETSLGLFSKGLGFVITGTTLVLTLYFYRRMKK